MVIYISIFLIDLSIRNVIIMDTTPLSSVTKGKEKERGLPWKAVVVSVTICYSCFTVCSRQRDWKISLYLLHTAKTISLQIFCLLSVWCWVRWVTLTEWIRILLLALSCCMLSTAALESGSLWDVRVRVLVVTRASICSRSIYSLFSSNLYDLDRTLIPQQGWDVFKLGRVSAQVMDQKASVPKQHGKVSSDFMQSHKYVQSVSALST